MKKQEKTIKEKTIDDLFKRLNGHLKKNKEIGGELTESRKAASKILADKEIAKMLVTFADTVNKTLNISSLTLKEEDNVVLIVKMLAYILATLENRDIIKIKH